MAYPDRVALVQDGRRICYVELQCRVDRLCHALQRLGVGRQERIAVLSQWLPFGLPLRRVIRWPLWHTFLGQTIGYGPSR